MVEEIVYPISKEMVEEKILAYWALACSASIQWKEFDIDKVIVIPDFEAEVTDRMLYIRPDYTAEDAIRTVMINHTDGSGMYLPGSKIIPPDILGKNFMFRGPYHKGLLSPFDYIKFCTVHGVKPVINDRWGQEHDLVKENIQIIMCDSQFKIAKLFKNYQEFKDAFKKNRCEFVIAQFEEDWPQDKTYNYQMTQSLVDFTNKEIDAYIAKTHEKIEKIAENKEAMLETLKAKDPNPLQYDKVALSIYPALLRDGYSKSQLKDIKKRMLLDAKSGTIKCKNKRLYVIPDWYAACEFWFCGIKNPKGLLEKDEIVCRKYVEYEKADVLRSPHLYCEHFIAKISKDPEVYKWFKSDGIVTSVHSLVSRILQFDVDGDMLNVVVEPIIVNVAERNLKEFDVIPLFYDANKAPAEMITKEAIFKGLERAHKFSNIGEISNMLTRLWNRDNPDRMAAALLTYLNNLRIDGAKTGFVNEYSNYPDIEKQINKAIGGPNGRLPWFFQNSKNGRRDKTTKKKKKRKWAKPNLSTMNRICRSFDDIGNINMNLAEVEPFNWQMLLSEPCIYSRPEIADEFVELDNIKVSIAIQNAEESPAEKDIVDNTSILDEHIIYTLSEKYGSLEYCYPHIVKYLFTEDRATKPAHKQTFWRIFGDIAVRNIRKNLKDSKICNKCKAQIPNWAKGHNCPKDSQGFYTCIECGSICKRINSRQQRCNICQEALRKDKKKEYRANEKTKERGLPFTTFWQSQNKRT